MKILHRVRLGARTYLALAGIGTAALVAAPFAAAYQMLKPDESETKKKQQREFFNKLNQSINLAGNQLHQALKDFDPFNGLDLLDPFGNEKWKQQHKQQHDMSDHEWEKKNLQRPK